MHIIIIIVSICTAYCENSLKCSNSFKEGSSFQRKPESKEEKRQGAIPISCKENSKRAQKEKNRKKVQLFVRQTIPNNSFITCLSEITKLGNYGTRVIIFIANMSLT